LTCICPFVSFNPLDVIFIVLLVSFPKTFFLILPHHIFYPFRHARIYQYVH
jgi:hypothetical protein